MDYRKIADEITPKILSYIQDTSGWKVVKTVDRILNHVGCWDNVSKNRIIRVKPGHQKNISVFQKPSTDYKGNIYRAETIMELPADKLFPFVYHPEYRSKWDRALQSIRIVETLDQDTFIYHSTTHSFGLGLVSPRDFVFVVHIEKYGDLLTTNSISVEHPDFPISPSYVRGFSYPSSYSCSPLPEDPQCSKLVAILQVDLGGMLLPKVVESVLPITLVNLITDCRAGIKAEKQAIAEMPTKN